MKNRRVVFRTYFVVFGVVIAALFGYVFLSGNQNRNARSITQNDDGAILSGSFDTAKLKTDGEWKRILTPEQFHILREAGTEYPFTGALNHEKRTGTYFSWGCDEPLFRSEAKFDSGTGWPSFYEPISGEALVLREDRSFSGVRIEVLDRCGGHLGHVFDDGPPPTGKRYCMNSEALYFVPDNERKQP